ncbi:MAG: PilN domain-containing protein [Firmicutes bacterium]|nr:PilN domain-containing protein [Bacillota bacterium]
MKDLNFFSGYSKKKEIKINKSYTMFGIISLFACILIFYSLYNFLIITKTKKILSAMKNEAEIIASNEKLKEVLRLEEKIESLEVENKKLKALDDYVNSKDIINEYLLLTIENSLPAKVFLKNMVINPGMIKIEGISEDRDSIAAFHYNIGKLDVFDKVFIPVLSDNEGYYTFTLDLMLKEGDKDEENS